VKFLRRVMLAVGLAGAVAGVLRVKGKGTVAQRRGGWRSHTPRS
jgi:hypothetical protein